MYNETAIKWAIDFLTINGYIIQKPYEIVSEMPWSKVIYFATDKGLVYCKQTVFYVEAAIMQILYDLFPGNIPKILATNNLLCCFLIQDAGILLRNKLKNNYDEALFCKALKTYANIQKTTIKHVDAILSTGVLDYRLTKLPVLYLQLINEKELSKKDGLTTAEINDLYKLHQTFAKQCEFLAQYKIPETIEHGDFHDNNILIQCESISIHDWGEATISHPFFSLASCLHMTTYPRIHNLQENDAKYLALRNAYLENWLEYAPMDKLVEAFLLIKKIRHFHCSSSDTFETRDLTN